MLVADDLFSFDDVGFDDRVVPDFVLEALNESVGDDGDRHADERVVRCRLKTPKSLDGELGPFEEAETRGARGEGAVCICDAELTVNVHHLTGFDEHGSEIPFPQNVCWVKPLLHSERLM